MARPGICSTLSGAKNVAKIESNIAAATVELSDEQMARLNVASSPALGFTASFAQPMIRRMVFGGHVVTGWME